MEDISLFTSKTLLAVQNDLQGNNTLLEKVHENVDALVSLKLVKKWTTTVDGEAATRVEATALGRATFKGTVIHCKIIWLPRQEYSSIVMHYTTSWCRHSSLYLLVILLLLSV